MSSSSFPITCILSFVFLSITCFRRQFLRKMWPIPLASLLFTVCGPFLSSLTLWNYIKEGVNLWKLFPKPHMILSGHTFQCIERCQRVAWNWRHTVWGVKRKELTGDWRKLYLEKLHDLYFFLNIIRLMKSRNMKHEKFICEFWWLSLNETLNT